MDQDDHIDGLLERYLHLLHEYTTLRYELAALQTDMYQDIARANFAAERGVRYGRDYYDDRMQASRRLIIDRRDQAATIIEGRDEIRSLATVTSTATASAITGLSGVVPRFVVVGPHTVTAVAASSTVGESEKDDAQDPGPRPDAEAKSGSAAQGTPTPSPLADADTQAGEDISRKAITSERTDDSNSSRSSSPSPSPPTIKEKRAAVASSSALQKLNNDPLRWFGILAPAPLRQAQTQAIRIVEHVIPLLASIDAEMAEVEIEVRRARKRRAKAEAAAGSRTPQQDSRGGDEAGRQTDAIVAGTTNDICT